MSEEMQEADVAEAEAVTAAAEESGGLIDQIMQETKMQQGEEGYDVARKGVEAFVAELLQPSRKGERVNKSLIDKMIVELDKKLSIQTDQILHHEKFQQMESAWRGLKFAIDRTDFRQNIKFELLNVSKHDLLEDFENSPDVTKSGLYKHVYTAEYGQFGGQPVGAMIANYEFGPGSQDIKLLQYSASVGAMSHAPFIAAADHTMFGVESYTEVPGLKELSAIFEGPKHTKWRGFRESEDSRYVGLTAPRFLLRTPYDEEDNPIKAFNYNEDVSSNHNDYLWGNTAYAFATRLTESFAKFRWCPNIIGPQSGGAVTDLPVHTFESMGELDTKIPTEILVSDRREFEMSEEGFIPLTMRKGSDNAAFFSANSAQKPKFFGNTKEGKTAETNYKLGTQLPYMFIINRLAHYIKVIQRENIGSWKQRGELEKELNKWISQYVADQENPTAEVRSRKPLRGAKITVEDVEGDPGWYRVSMDVQPHFKYMGASFTLSLKGKLDQN